MKNNKNQQKHCKKLRFIAFNPGQRPVKLMFKSTKKKILRLKEFQHFHQLNNRDTRVLVIEYIDNTFQRIPLKTLSESFVTVKNKDIASFWLENESYFQQKGHNISGENKGGTSFENTPLNKEVEE